MRQRCALAVAAVSALSVGEARAQVPPVPSPTPDAVASSESPALASPAPAPIAPPAASPAPSPAAAAPRPALPPVRLSMDQIRSRERMALVSLSTVVLAQKTYASLNRNLFDSMTCLTQPAQCLPGQKDAAPVLDPGYDWLEPRLGYVMRFHPGPGATPDEIRRIGASPSSIKSFAVTLTPEHPGLTGGRAFCGDSSGKMCVTDGSAPPVKDGRCEPCKKLQ